jgi:hypothetical protein
MNGLGDEDLRARLGSVFDDEPQLTADAADDLARGRLLLRRRRRTALVATATAIPAVLVGGWAVSTAALGSSGSATRLQPADATESSPDDDTVTVCWVGSAPADSGEDAPTVTVGPDDPPASAPAGNAATTPPECEAVPWVAGDCSVATLNLPEAGDPASAPEAQVYQASPDSLGTADSGGSARAGTDERGVNAAPDGPNSTGGGGGASGLHEGYALTVAPGDSGSIGFACDPLGAVLQEHADPKGEHAGSSASGTAEATTGDGPQAQSATIGWADGDREGQVTLSVAPTSGATDCNDPDLAAGPSVSCERRSLDDGTVVWVGHGAQDDAERVSVQFDRPDGTTVWATADEATDAWWHGDGKADPLTAPPMTVDDLTAMALDKGIDALAE